MFFWVTFPIYFQHHSLAPTQTYNTKKFDKNAVKVTNLTGKSIGHIKKEQALSLSARLAKLGNDITVDCTVINNGDGYNQKLLCVFQKKNTKEGDPVASASANSTSTTVVAITPSKIVSPYLTK
mmetsp:Transcript_230/g.264  ORF Transcript_230/g.264 Transcript_230/m.264 type:complete len:124 (+) Transcript_230:70-441(+)